MALFKSLCMLATARTVASASADVCEDPARCAAAAIGTEEQSVSLLQVNAAAADHVRPGAANVEGAKTAVKAAVASAASAAVEVEPAVHPAKTAAKPPAFVGVVAEGNKTAGRIVKHGDVTVGRVYGDGTCGKLSGGTCLITGSCDASRSATCSGRTGLCVCEDYTCASEAGSCDFSASEVAAAVAGGVTNVGEQVSSLANAIPGVAQGVSSVSGILDTAGQVVSETLGIHSGCGRLVTSCVFSGCPGSVENTATCNYGACSCMQNFCYSELNGQPYCTVDVQAISDMVSAIR